MSFTTRIKFLNSNNNNKKKKDTEMTQLKASLVATNPANDENPCDDAEKYVDIDGIKFKLTESEEDEDEQEEGEHNEDATSTTSSSHEVQKAKKRKSNQDAKKKSTAAAAATAQKPKKEQKQQQQQQQDKLDKSKNEMLLKINKRKVSLGRFEPNAALYPVCRAWMVNEQESKYIDLDYLFIQYVKRPENGLKLLKALIDDDISCISLMPAPASKEIDDIDGMLKSRTPPAGTLEAADGDGEPVGCGGSQCQRQLQQQQQSNKTALDNIIKRLENNDTEDCPSTVALLREHLQRWKRVKANWKRHTRAYDEERYGVNFAILDTMFKMQMRKPN